MRIKRARMLDLELWTAHEETGNARASRAAVNALVHRTAARHRATFQPGCTDDARWRASGTHETRVLPVQKACVVTTSSSFLASAPLVRFGAPALL